MFTWIPIHEEAARKALSFRASSNELITTLQEMGQRGLKVISLEDKDGAGNPTPLTEIDPFSFLASFNRQITEPHRLENWRFLKERWGLAAKTPEDFAGIPVVHNLQSWFFPWSGDRATDHIGQLWTLAAQVADRRVDQIDEALFNRCAELPIVGFRKLTIGVFWISPTQFLPADKKTIAYGLSNGISPAPDDFRTYLKWIQKMTAAFGTNYAQVSHAAHLSATGADIETEPVPLPAKGRRFWLLGAGKGGREWKNFQDEGIATIGWEGTPDLRGFATKDDIRKRLQESNPDSSKKNDAHACWQFVHDINKGDIVFAKQGLSKVFGYGIVTGDYSFEQRRSHHKHVRTMNWLGAGDWELPPDSQMPMKTLTDITNDASLLTTLAELVGLDLDHPPVRPPTDGTAYWWLNANPKIWDLESAPVGARQTYTSHNEKGNKRQKFRYFEEIKPGDLLVGYVTSPDREVVAICRITKGLHPTDNGDAIEFEKIEQLNEPIPYSTLRDHPDLSDSEPIGNNQGSLFKLTEPEYEIIRSLIDELNLPTPTNIKPYSKHEAIDGLFLSEATFEDMLSALRERKNIVLQGAPGVGKTFIARRLGHAFVGAKDPQRVQVIQFHQSYSYEDFVQGFRPTQKGFELKPGLFYQFCRRAQRQESEHKPHVLIIDEINRGNLSKIFGELLMLIEPDKRGREFAIPLAYSEDADDTFFVPDNLYLIGMMNTADRSLALVDYALRRRFRFITLRPEFASKQFQRWLGDAGVSRDLIKKIVTRMSALNEVIAADTKNLGSGYQIGHSYFCPAADGGPPDDSWYRRVVDTEIVPLLREYWFDNEPKVDEHRTALLA